MAPHPLCRSLLPAVAVVLFVVAAAQACPTCSQALAHSQGGDLVAGYFWSIVFMMSMPFLIVAGLGLYFYLMVRKARAAQAAQAAAIAGGFSTGSREAEPAENELVEV